jgi:Mn2+/Fe2+ NRAMP family transporter
METIKTILQIIGWMSLIVCSMIICFGILAYNSEPTRGGNSAENGFDLGTSIDQEA